MPLFLSRMRNREKEGKTRNLVFAPKELAVAHRTWLYSPGRARISTVDDHTPRKPADLARHALCCGLSLALLCLSACDGGKKPRTEWRPEDHQPPPAELPEGQGAAEESGDPTARAAKALWSMRCAQCHGEDGHGDGTGRPPGAVLPDFASADFQQKRSDVEIYQVIEKGRNMMPAFGQEITRQGIDALIGHVRTLRAK
jgi:mono/diheme cytochrome c family protein